MSFLSRPLLAVLVLFACLPISAAPVTDKPPPVPVSPKADPAAQKAIDNAVAELSKVKWIDAKCKMQIDVQGLAFTCDGRFRSGPDHRLRLDASVVAGGVTGELQYLCDGTWIWESLKLGDGERTVRRINREEFLKTLTGESIIPQTRDEFFPFGGLANLVSNLGQKKVDENKPAEVKMVPVKTAEFTRGDTKLIKVFSVWPEDIVKRVTQDGKHPWPPFVPRQCVCVLDAKTSMPERFEAWGPVPGGEAVVFKMEFSDPKLDVEIPADVFQSDKSTKEVPDITKDFVKRITDRNKYHSEAAKPQPTPGK